MTSFITKPNLNTLSTNEIAKRCHLTEQIAVSIRGKGKKISGHIAFVKSLAYSRRAISYILGNAVILQSIQEASMHNQRVSSTQPQHKEYEKHKPQIDVFLASRPQENELQIEARNDKTRQRIHSKKKLVKSTSICTCAIEHCKPTLETRKVRKGARTYLVPFVATKRRQAGIAIKWLRESSRKQSTQDFVKGNIKPTLRQQQARRKGVVLRKTKSVLQNQDFSKITQVNSLTPITNFRYLDFLNASQIESAKKCTQFQLVVQKKQKFQESLTMFFRDCFQKTASTTAKRRTLQTIALQNRAYTHLRWW